MMLKKSQSGFTLVEIVIAIMMAAAIMTLLLTTMGPAQSEKMVSDTQQKLQLLASAAERAYLANSFTIDNSDEASTQLPGHGKLVLKDSAASYAAVDSYCPQFTGQAGYFDGAMLNIQPLQAYASSSVQDLAKDGYNNSICTLVSQRATTTFEGQQLYYHAIAFVSPGSNNLIDPDTKIIADATPSGEIIWKLQLSGDDTGVIIDGSKYAIQNFKTTKTKIERLARAYEVYFKARYNARRNKEMNYNYFYASANSDDNGEPNGTTDTVTISHSTIASGATSSTMVTETLPGSYEPTPPRGYAMITQPVNSPVTDLSQIPTVIDNGIWYVLGLNDSDLLDAWGNPIYFDNFSARVRNGAKTAPYTAQFLAPLPGIKECTSIAQDNCRRLVIATSIGTY